MKKYILIGGLIMSILVPLPSTVAHAALVDASKCQQQQQQAANSGSSAIIQNPIKANNIQCLVLYLFQLAVNVLAYVAVGYLLWAGFLFVKAQGNDKELAAAKQTLINALIGITLIFGAWVFAEIISNTITSVTNNSTNLSN